MDGRFVIFVIKDDRKNDSTKKNGSHAPVKKCPDGVSNGQKRVIQSASYSI